MRGLEYNRGVGVISTGIHLIAKESDVTPLQEEILARDCHFCGSSCSIPFGLCHCGCGLKTNECPRNDNPRKWVKGQPQKFRKGHTDKDRQKTKLVSGKCICGQDDCTTPYGYCHCGCGQKTPLATQTAKENKRIQGEHTSFVEHHGSATVTKVEQAAPFKIDGVYCRLIPLTQGLYTIVWESDYEWLMQWKWYAERRPENGKFYAARTEHNKGNPLHFFMHRVIVGLEIGDPLEGDHKYPPNTLDNRRSNLRKSDRYGQAQNTRKKSNNTSGYKGVSYDKRSKGWKAQIMARGKYRFLGRFATKEAAYAAYCAAAKLYHGEFACVS